MANFQAYNDRVWTLPPIQIYNPVTNTTATAVSLGTFSSLTITSSLPNSLGVAGTSAGGIQLTPKVKNSPGITVTVSGGGYTPASFLVDIVTDPNAPSQLVVDSTQADATSVGQNVPTAAGP